MVKATRRNARGRAEANKNVRRELGPDEEIDCIFPFRYDRNMYDACVRSEKGAYCATEVDDATRQLRKYGYCQGDFEAVDRMPRPKRGSPERKASPMRSSQSKASPKRMHSSPMHSSPKRMQS